MRSLHIQPEFFIKPCDKGPKSYRKAAQLSISHPQFGVCLAAQGVQSENAEGVAQALG